MALVDIDIIAPWSWQNRVQAKKQDTSTVQRIASQVRPYVEKGDFAGAQQALQQAAPAPPQPRVQSPLMKRVGERVGSAFEEMKAQQARMGVQGTAKAADDGGFLDAVKGGVMRQLRPGNVLKALGTGLDVMSNPANALNPRGQIVGRPGMYEQEGGAGERAVNRLAGAGEGASMNVVSGERFVNNLAGQNVTRGLPTPARYAVESFAAPVTLATAGSAGLAGGGLKAVGQAVAKRWALEGTSDLAGRVTAEQVANRLPEGTPAPVRIGTSLLAGVAGGAATYKGLQQAPGVARAFKEGIDAQGGLAGELGQVTLPGRGGAPLASAAASTTPPPPPPSGGYTVMSGSGQPLHVPDVGTAGIQQAIAEKLSVFRDPNSLVTKWAPVRKAASWLAPAVDMDKQVLSAYRAKAGVRASLRTQFDATLDPYIRRVEALVTKDAPEYIGPAATTPGQKALIGTIKDMADRPEAYRIAPDLRAAMDDLNVAQWNDVSAVVRGQFGVEVRPFTASGKPGFVHLPTVRTADTEADKIAAQLAALGTKQGAKTRAYATAWERAAADAEFIPETNIRELTGIHSEAMASDAANQTFRQGAGGKTLTEVMDELHPGLKQKRDDLTQSVASLRARVNTMVRQAGGLDDEADELDRALAQFDRGMPAGGMRPLSRLGTVLANAQAKVDALRADKPVRMMTGGGPVRLTVPPTDAALAQAGAMEKVTKAFGDVIPDDVKQVSKLDTAMARTRRRIDLLSARRDIRIANLPVLKRQLEQAENELQRWRTAYQAAEIDPQQYVREPATMRYYRPEAAKTVSSLLSQPAGKGKALIELGDEIRAFHLAGDASPLTMQGQLAVLSDPVNLGAAIKWLGVDRSDPRAILRQVAQNEVDDVRDYTRATGRAFGQQAFELSATQQGKRGLARIPGVKPVEDWMFSVIELAQYRSWQRDRDLLLKMNPGRDRIWAANESARAWEKIIPSLSPAERGVSATRGAVERTLLTSASFAASPAMLTKEAASGLVKLGLARTMDPVKAWRTLDGREQIAIMRLSTFAGLVAMVSGISAAASAPSRNMSVEDAIKRAVFDWNSPEWMSLQLGEGRRIPIGGPLRGFIKAMLPDEDGVPMARMGDWLEGRLNTLPRVTKDLIRNEDWRGNKIVKGDFPENILRTLAYGVESTVPLAAGEVMEQFRTGEATIGSAITGAVSQLAGTNYVPPSPSERLHQVAREEYGKDFWGLSPSQKKAVREREPGLWRDYVASASEETQLANAEKQRFMDEQAADDAAVLRGELGLDDWSKALDDRRNQLVGAEKIIYRNLESGGKRDPILDGYYAAIDEATVNGRVDWNAVDDYKASLPTADLRYINENTGLTQTALTKLRKEMGSQYYALPRYRGFSAEEARDIDALYQDARNMAGPRADNPAVLVRAIREAARQNGYEGKAVRGALLRANGQLPQTTHRERWLRAHPEGVLLTGSGRMSKAQQTAIKQALAR